MNSMTNSFPYDTETKHKNHVSLYALSVNS